MARADRGVAQRYAAKKRKRRPATVRPAGASPALAESVGSLAGERTVPHTPFEAAIPERQTTITFQRSQPAAAAKLLQRRPFSSYAADYRYILGDLRRVVLVAGVLLLALIVLSFFIQ